MTVHDFTFDIQPIHNSDKYEIVLCRNGKPRQLAICNRIGDAEEIVKALCYALGNGEI